MFLFLRLAFIRIFGLFSSDLEFFIFLKNNYKDILNLRSNIVKKAIFRSCKIKKAIVEKDEREINLRKTLKLEAKHLIMSSNSEEHKLAVSKFKKK